MFNKEYYEPCMDTILDVNMIQDIAFEEECLFMENKSIEFIKRLDIDFTAEMSLNYMVYIGGLI
jgi:hypothetical protein